MDAHVFKHILIQTHSPWKNLAYYPYCIRVVTFLQSTAPPPRCVCVCVRGKHWRDREGVTNYSMGVSVFLRSTINKTPLVFDPLMRAGYPLPTDRQAEGVKEQVQTIAVKSEWCESISLTTWTWCSLRAGLNSVITAITASRCIDLCGTRQSAGELWRVWHILTWNGIVMLLNIAQKQDNMSERDDEYVKTKSAAEIMKCDVSLSIMLLERCAPD